jgi:tetratricopeptide (TPR) repeat protein
MSFETNPRTTMNPKKIRTLLVAFISLVTPCLLDQARADQPRMDKAIELLEQAKTAKSPIELLEKAKTAVENATTGKGGRRFTAMNKIDKAIIAKKKGKDANPLIDEAIADLKEGKEIQKDKKGK